MNKMKKLIPLLIISLILILALAVPQSNWRRYLFAMHGGIKVGNTIEETTTNKTGSLVLKIDSIATDNTGSPTNYRVMNGGDTLNPVFSTATRLRGTTLYAPKYITDTLNLTNGRNLVLADAGRWLSSVKGTEARIRVPADTTVNFPVGTVINVSMDGAGLVHFTKGTGVFFLSEKDSVCINTKWGVATLVKRASNRWRIFGSLTD